MFHAAPPEEDVSPNSVHDIKIMQSLLKIDTQVTCDFNQKSSSMIDLDRKEKVDYLDEISELKAKNDYFSVNNNTILEEPSAENSQHSSNAPP